jgi:hypothetical protein
MRRLFVFLVHWVSVPAMALLLALLLAACGGGGEMPSQPTISAVVAAPAAPAASAPAATVRLAGCVVDDYFQPRRDTPLRARGADGRLLGNAQSDARGAFSLQLPTGQEISLAIDKADGDVIQVATGHRSRALTTCLVDPSA